MKRVLSVSLALAATVAVSHASLFSETFNYPDGPIVANSAGVWNHTSGTAGTCLVSNKTLLQWGGNLSRTEAVNHQFSPGYGYMTNGFTQLDNIWARFTAKWTGDYVPTGNGSYFFSFATDTTSHFSARTIACTTNSMYAGSNCPPGNFFLGEVNSAQTYPGPSGTIQTMLTTGVTYTVVVRQCFTNGLATIWVGTDPTTMSQSGSAQATATDTPFFGTSNFVNWVCFRQSSSPGTCGSILINDFKVGVSWDDVFFAPNISAIIDQSIPANHSTPALPFTVGSAQTTADHITVTATSSNPTLIPNATANLALASDVSGTNRTITVTPAADQQGTAIITVTATVGSASSTSTFKVIVGAPIITPIPPQIFYVGATVPVVPLTVTDPENDPVTVWIASSSNTNLLTTNNIVLGGSGKNRTLTLTPAAGQGGATFITINATDGHNTTSSTFTLTMRPHIGVVYSEDFKYTDFSQGDQNQLENAIGGSGGPWTRVSGNTLQLAVTNYGSYGLAYLSYTNTSNLGAAFSGGNQYYGTNGVVLYTAFTVNFSALPANNGDYFFMLKTNATDGSSYHDKITAQRQNAAPGRFRLAIANFASGATAQFPADLRTNVTYTVVSRYNAATGEAALWINPYSEQSMYCLANDNPGWANVGGVGLREPGSSIGNLALGPIIISSEWSDLNLGSLQPLQIQMTDATHAQLTWSGYSFTLQTATSVSGPWSDVTGATSPHPVTVTPGSNQFFRLAY